MVYLDEDCCSIPSVPRSCIEPSGCCFLYFWEQYQQQQRLVLRQWHCKIDLIWEMAVERHPFGGSELVPVSVGD